jgi:thiamine transport system ATP-binding protein
MHEGRIEQVGSPVDVWQRPANAFVARFLGWNVTAAFTGTTAAVRPEAIRVGAEGRVVGTVARCTFRRDHFLVDVDVAGTPLEEIVQVEVPLGSHVIPQVGDAIALDVADDDLVPLD